MTPAQTKTKLRLAARRRREDRIHEAKVKLGRLVDSWNLDPQSPIWEVCLREREGWRDHWRHAAAYVGKAPTLVDACKRAIAIHRAKLAIHGRGKRRKGYLMRIESAKMLAVSSW